MFKIFLIFFPTLIFADIHVGNSCFVFLCDTSKEVESRLIEFEQNIQLAEGVLLRAFKDPRSKSIIYFAASKDLLDIKLIENHPLFVKKHSCVERREEGTRFLFRFEPDGGKCRNCNCLLSPFSVLVDFDRSKTAIVCVFYPKEKGESIAPLLDSIALR